MELWYFILEVVLKNLVVIAAVWVQVAHAQPEFPTTQVKSCPRSDLSGRFPCAARNPQIPAMNSGVDRQFAIVNKLGW